MSRPGRTGTWQFMSASSSPDKEHEVSDDLESIIHLHRTPNQLRLHVAAMYEGYDVGRITENWRRDEDVLMRAGSTYFSSRPATTPS
ncbi:uncharacterized protein B0H18DRAFT_987238, partial [Fomitopsis serialis]|uniref:uncharacterized protein n=1 Tax=Fomitopsis serialis TaxID=139415 RepID=UPI0020085F4D